MTPGVHLFLLSVLNKGEEIIQLWTNFYPLLNSSVITAEQKKFILPFTERDCCLLFPGIQQLLSTVPGERAAIQRLIEVISPETENLCG